ncbi:MAG TPA: sulfite exporter TauE/SafE family protein [Stellaceae bacterium]|jgi:uncharacterized membrane protein YfcA
MPVIAWAGMAATCFFAALLQATNGFGFAVLAVPFFLILAPPDEAIRIILVLSLAMSVVVVPGVRKSVEPRLLTRLTLGSFAGLPLGLLAFSYANPLAVRAAAGALVVVFALVLAESRWTGRHPILALSPVGDLLFGVVAGAATALVGMSGPPVLIYLMLAGAPAQLARATLLSFFFFIYAATVAAETVFFGMPAHVWLTAASLVPFAWVGGIVGLRVGDRLDPVRAAMLAIGVLGASGLYTLAAAARTALW